MDDRYRQYFDALPCFLTVQDRNLKILSANRAFRKAFGEHEGRFCYQVYKKLPEQCEVCPVERTFRDGQMHQSEEVVTTLDGRELAVVVYTTPVRDEGGNIVAVMEMSADVTEIKHLQKQHKASRELYRLLFEEVPCYISIQDPDMRIVRANRLHRETFGTAYGCHCYKILKHRDEECVPCVVRESFKTGQVTQREEVVKALDGKERYVLVTAAPIRDEGGGIERVIEMSADITCLRVLQDKLSSVGLLVGSISHDLKGLLNIMDGGIYMVNSGITKGNMARVNRGWEISLRSMARIRSLVQNILYYAKDRELVLERISARDLLTEVCDQVEPRAKELGIDLQRTFDHEPGEFDGDLSAVRSLMINLLENSLDACRVDLNKEDHRVSAGFTDLPDAVRFEVVDNGIGMDQETVDRAFSLFYSSKGAGGTGLGLFIADRITKAHGGEIDLHSEPGKGTRFAVRIPKGLHQPVVDACSEA